MHIFRFCLLISFISIYFPLNIVAQKHELTFRIEGIITDSITSEPLFGVSVTNIQLQKNENSKISGSYGMRLLAGLNNIRFSLLGYQSRQIEVIGNSNISKNISLAPAIRQLSEVTITAQNWQQRLEGTGTGTFQLNRKEISSLPVLLGETDYFKVIQLLPGVKSTGEGNAAIYVRGGGFDQNLVLLDEATVYNPTHLLGFYSIFNSDVIGSVKVIKSGIPAEFGNRLSSVIEFNTNKDIPEKVVVKGNLGLLSSRLAADIPLLNKRIVVSVAARKTYLNSWLNLFRATNVIHDRSILYKSGYDFYDLNATVNATINSKNKLSLGFYGGADIFRLISPAIELDNTMEWGNKIGSLTWNKVLTNKLYMENSLVYSGYRLDMNLAQNQYKFNLVSSVSDYGFKNKFRWLLPNHKIDFGVSTIHHSITPNTSKASSDNVVLNLGKPNNYSSMESSIFAADEITVNKKLNFYLGFRYNIFNHLGEFNKYVHNNSGTITDTIPFGRWKPVTHYANIDVRTAIRYLIRDNLSVKLSFNSNSQYVHLVNASSVTFPTDFWISSSDKVKPQKGLQWAAGIFNFNKTLNLETSVEVYYKTLANQIEFYKGLLSAMNNRDFDENLIYGKGRAFGAEFLIRKTAGKVTGWLGYTLSKTEKSFSQIESSRWFPARYDHPNDLSLALNYNTKKKWSFSAVFVYASGSAYTPVVERYIISNNIINEFGQYNSARLPAYHRCDISATMQLRHKEGRESKLVFSVYNVYNRRNPFFIYPEVTGTLQPLKLSISPKEVSIFPILPSVGWEFRF